jgi:ABC-type sulfate transport system substrate-binding protein
VKTFTLASAFGNGRDGRKQRLADGGMFDQIDQQK